MAAYAGQGPNLLQRPLVVAALSIHSVEARHAAWIRFMNSAAAAARAAATSPTTRRRGRSTRRKSEKKVLSAVTATGFIKG